MTAITVGRICIKTAGKDAGKYCVITEMIDDNFVEITGPKSLNKIKRKKCNIAHLEPTNKILDIKEKSDDDIVIKTIEDSKLSEIMKERIKFN
ncbi:MAG: 50S ribosomal protein L14e [DPANN group archaeon]|nr:50S ribosomal protein L14e [DPANN group archaeon]